MHKHDLKPDMHSTNAMAALGFAFGQVALFVGLHDLSLSLAAASGEPSHVNGGVGWGIMVEYSIYIFAVICLVSRFLALSFSSWRVLFPLIGFVLFASLFVDDLFHVRSLTYPKRALLLVSCAFAALVFPYLNFRNKTRPRASNEYVLSPAFRRSP